MKKQVLSVLLLCLIASISSITLNACTRTGTLIFKSYLDTLSTIKVDTQENISFSSTSADIPEKQEADLEFTLSTGSFGKFKELNPENAIAQ